jgi:hypothetical protein
MATEGEATSKCRKGRLKEIYAYEIKYKKGKIRKLNKKINN